MGPEASFVCQFGMNRRTALNPFAMHTLLVNQVSENS